MQPIIEPFGNPLSQWGGYGMGPGMMGGWGYGLGWIGVVFMVAFWVLLIVGIVYLIRWAASATRQGEKGRGDDALEILRKRYARGEIGREEFEQKKKDLEA
ncbi:MAG: hypothetical protein Kow0025_07690 [Thermodesulfovibrionales bacterium]